MIRRITKYFLFLFCLLLLPVFIDAQEYNESLNIAGNYLNNSTYKDTYSRYIFIPSDKVGFYNATAEDINFLNLGGMLSKEEVDITLGNKSNITFSYLYNGNAYWTLSKGNSNNLRYVVDNSFSSDSSKSTALDIVNSESNYVKTKVTEYVKNDTKIYGNGSFSDPWFFLPQYKLTLKVNNPSYGKIYSNGFNSDLVDSVEFILTNNDSATLNIKPNSGYLYLGNTCGYVVNDISAVDNQKSDNPKDENYILKIQGLTKDTECVISFGEKPLEVNLDQSDTTTHSNPEKLFLKNKINWYLDYSMNTQVSKIPSNPLKKGYIFKGYYREKTLSDSPNGVCNGSDKKYIDENGYLTNDVTLLNEISDGIELKTCFVPNTFKIVYDKNDSLATGTMSEQSCIYDQSCLLLENEFSKVGYKLSKWVASNGKEYDYDEKTDPTNDLTNIIDKGTAVLKAQWEANTYLVSFDTNGGGSAPKGITVKYDSPYGELPSITRTGYSFDGWYTAKDGGNKVTSSTIVNLNSSHTLYAKWSSKSYKVTFDANGGTNLSTASIDVLYNHSYGTLPTVNKSGFTFEGWYTLEEGGTEVTNSTVLTNASNHTLYAHWSANTYTVTFDGNGGTSSKDSIKVTFYSKYGSLPTASRTGYTFIGWYTAASDGTEVTSNSYASTPSNHTLYAHWSSNGYTATLDGNGATYYGTTSVTVFYNNNLPAISYLPQRKYKVTYNANGGTVNSYSSEVYYTFNGYYLNSVQYYKPDGTGTKKWDVADNATLTANWTSNNVVLETPTRNGYTFDGWYDSASGGTRVGSGGDSYAPKSNITLYARWSPIIYYIKFSPGTGGTGTMSTMTLKYTEEKNLIANAFTRTGYSFNGWSGSNGRTYANNASVYNLSTTHGATITLTAQWKSNDYTVTLNGNGATSTTHTKSITPKFDSAMPSITIPSREYTVSFNKNGGTVSSSSLVSNYKFEGYYYDSTQYYTSTGSSARNWDKASAVTLNASWSGGSITLPNATREGYLLEGWYTAASGGTRVGSAGTSYIPESNITLYPRWTPITYYIKFVPGTGTGTMSQMTMRFGEIKKLTTNSFTKTGYSFSKWSGSNGTYYDNNAEVSNLTTTNGNTITMTATWSGNKYTATLNANGATSTNHTTSVSVTYDAAMPSIVIPSRSLVVSYNANMGNVSPTSSSAVSKFNGYYIDNVQYYNSTGGSVRTWNKAGNATLIANWNDSSVTLPLPTRNCYTFNGWYTAATDGTLVGMNGSNYTPNKNVTLYAHWKPNSYTVTLNANGATSTNHTTSLTATCDSAMPSITKPTRSYTVTFDANTGNVSTTSLISNYTFSGYYFNSTQYYTSTGSSAKYWGEAANTTLTAKWSGGTITLPSATKSGYVFAGWYTAKDGGTKIGNAGASYSPTANTTLYARWSSNSYNVTLDGNGATSKTHTTSINATYDGTLTSITKLPERKYLVTYDSNGGSSVSNSTSSYEFQGYYKNNTQYYNADGVGVKKWDIPENTTLSAKWDDGVVTLPVTSKDGYIFNGWYTAKTGGNLIGLAGAGYTPSSDITLYAQWTPITYYIKFSPGDGSGTMSNMTVKYDQTVTLTANSFTRGGYSFSKWSGSNGGSYSDKQSVSNLTKTNGATITMTATWSASTYNPTINGNGGTCTPTNVTVKYGSAMPGTVQCTRSYTVSFNGNGGTPVSSSLVSNYKFNGLYYNSVQYYNASGTSARTWNVASNVSLSANWSGVAITLPKATKTGYILKGWYTAASGGTKVGAADETYIPDANKTLYAQWTPISYTIKFDSNGGSGTMSNMTVSYGSSVALTSNVFTRTGYTFNGWSGSNGSSYSNGQSISNLTTVNGSIITMKAKWTANGYTANINANGGSCTPTSVGVSYGSAMPSISCSERKYTISFNANGGTTATSTLTSIYTLDGFYYNSNQYYNGSGVGVKNWDVAGNATLTAKWSGGAITLPSVTRDGYTFKGWYTAASGGTKVGGAGASYSPTSGLTLYAQWTANSYTVSINGNGGTCTPTSVTATYGSAMPAVTCSTRKYTVSFNANGGTAASSSLTGTYSLNGLYYNSVQYYKSDGTSARTWDVASAATVSAQWDGGTITLPNATRIGYIFNGWYTAASGGTKIGNAGATYKTSANTTLYAQWTRISYTIKFATSCGSGTMSSMTMYYGDIKNLTQNAFTCTGHTFNGWSGSNGVSYADKAEVSNLSTTNGATITMTAKWNPVSYPVTINGNGGTCTPTSVSVKYGSAMPGTVKCTRSYTVSFNGNGGTPSSASLNSNYKFNGLYYNSVQYYNASGTSARTWNVASTVSLSANWSSVAITLPSATRSGYKFNGWYTATSGGTKIGNAGATYTPSAGTTLYAQWTPISYTIKFDSNGGTGTIASMSMTYGTAKNLTANSFTKTGYNFGGWSCSNGSSYTNQQSVSNLTTTDGATVTMTAKWNPNTYYVTYNADGGSNIPDKQSFKFNSGDKISTTIPTKTGYSFVKWVSDPNSVDFAPGATIPNGWGSFSLNPQWKADTYTVTYNANGGSGAPGSQTKTYGVTLTLSSTKPTRDGYDFQGWSTSSTATSATYTAGGSYTANSGTTLYAVWKLKTYTVSYNANGGSGAPSAQTKTHGVTLTLSSTKPTRDGYIFQGWGTSSTATTVSYAAGASYTANSGTTLYAIWKQNAQYTVTFDGNVNNLTGGYGYLLATFKKKTVSNVPAAVKGSTVTLPEGPTATGNGGMFIKWTFVGWSTDATASGQNPPAYKPGETITVTKDTTLYALWYYTSTTTGANTWYNP